MMMMLTTQLAYTPTLSASARSQTLQSNTPLNTNNASTAIGLVETDNYNTGEQSMQVVGNPQARSGKVGMIGVGLFMLVAAFVTAFMTNESIRGKVIRMFRSLTGGKNEETSPEVKPSGSETPSTVAKKQRRHQHQELATA